MSGLSGGAVATPARYAEGLQASYATDDTATISPGSCRDSADAGDISLASAVTVDKSLPGVINGLDQLTLTGTGQKVATTALTGTGTAFLTEFGTRALTGTVSTTGTAVTGTSTLFLSELAVGDLLGNAANGYSRVTAIASDTGATLVAAIPGGDLAAASTNAIENATVEVGGAENRRIETIVSNTSLTVDVAWTAGAAGQTIVTGTFAVDQWAAVWVVSGTSGSGGLVSTQRTTLLNPPTGYTASERRIGWMRNDGSGNFLRYFYEDGTPDRWAYFNGEITTNILVAGVSATYDTVLADDFCPPTATLMQFRAILDMQGAGSASTDLRPRNTGLGEVASTWQYVLEGDLNDRGSHTMIITMDGAQAIEYRRINNMNVTLSQPQGFLDEL